jgi:hypothetical protein
MASADNPMLDLNFGQGFHSVVFPTWLDRPAAVNVQP